MSEKEPDLQCRTPRPSRTTTSTGVRSNMKGAVVRPAAKVFQLGEISLVAQVRKLSTGLLPQTGVDAARPGDPENKRNLSLLGLDKPLPCFDEPLTRIKQNRFLDILRGIS